jgi:ribonucleoside-diphosphate reductase alpha chain
VEPWKANAFTHKTLSGSHFVKNKHLEALLEEKGLNTKEVWKGITTNGGSVQHLMELNEYERDVFKTADEIDQRWIVDHAADRQPFICQAQSINLFIPQGMDIKDFSHLHVRAWKKGLKTLYYCRSAPTRRAENLNSKVERMYLEDQECLSCQA